MNGEGDIGGFLLPGAGLDHWPIGLEWSRPGEFIKRPFRFEKFWMMHPNFKRLIMEWWKGMADMGGSRMFNLQQNLKHIKENLKKWNKETFGNIMKEKLHLEAQIGEIQIRAMQNGYSDEERNKEGKLIKELTQREKQEEILWRQKSRQMLLKEGDRNTRFFHKETIANRQQNRISKLKTATGQIVERQENIEGNLVQFYSDPLQEMEETQEEDIKAITRHIPSLVTQEHNIMLKRKIEHMEVEEAVFQMEKGKAPGLDGFTIDFFQRCWDLVKQELWEVVEESRSTRRVLKEFNATFLTLIPKEQGADLPGKFRLISLCNVVLKIITKVMAN